MTKTITFIRHAKSSWEYRVSDKNRPLKERGISDAILVAKELNQLGGTIDFAWSSPANRALHTAMIVLGGVGYDFKKFQVSNTLYDFSGEDVLGFIRSLHNGLDHVLLFGHNHAFTSLVNTLGDTYISNVPTAGLVRIVFKTDDWSTINKGTTLKTIFPKELK